ncbi:unnamed protein product [Spirodela intermedia]|uniref:Uncharacterized protein n=1 Tax=Spirodela intermedia TaxID=51605 RepID=A0A7I8IIX6_SPIIN|nr:unnamed protein product [Spirodela intermedia]CAA6656914.1 unnamed protein product [Spirodela intermedia]
MASSSSWVPDAWGWVCGLPAVADWSANTISLCVCPSSPPSPSLNLSVGKSLQNQRPCIFFSVAAVFDLPLSLWTSGSFVLKSGSLRPWDENIPARLFSKIVAGVLHYGPRKGSSSRRSPPVSPEDGDSGDVFNLAFLTLVLLVCIYEAPQDFRAGWMDAIKLQMTSTRSRDALKALLRLIGSNFEEQWMKSVNLAITNHIQEFHGSPPCFRTPSPLFSYAVSAAGLWKVQFYCPHRLLFSLMYQQLQGVVQLAYKLVPHENTIDMVVTVDNVRCDVSPLVSRKLMGRRGLGPEEKHFPSRVSLQLTPAQQDDVLSVTASKSSSNPAYEVSRENAVEGSFDPPAATTGFRFSAAETVTMSMKPWKFEQSVRGATAGLHWFLHDVAAAGKEVSSSKPHKLSLFRRRSWFRNRQTNAYRPFTRDGGVVFAGDEYGESVRWQLLRRGADKKMEWEVNGSVWVTYWPNQRRSFYSETRTLEFKETVHVSLP